MVIILAFVLAKDVKHANLFFPFIFIAQLPQIPSLQDLRNDNVVSKLFFILIKVSKIMGPYFLEDTKYVSIQGCTLRILFHL